MIPAKLRYTVRKLFENSGFEEFQNNRKSGVLNVRALPTMAHNDRLFKRRKEHDGIDSAVTIPVVTFGCEVSLLKDFNVPYQRVRPMLERLQSGGGTQDFTALSYAHGLLLNRQEERKVCFFLTDGIGNADACREQALSGENLGITTIGVGIRSDVTHIYKNAVTIEKLEDMGTVAFDKLKLAV